MDSLASLQSLSTVPKLDVDGGNWPIFRIKFKIHMTSAGLDEHFDNSKTPAKSYEDIEAKPTKQSGEKDNDFKKCLDVWTEGEDKWKEGVRAWMKEDAKTKAMLGKVLPNSVFMEFVELETFYEMWKAIETCTEKITLHQKSNLKGRLNQMYCDEKTNIITHLEEMESIYQQLTSQNAKISDEDYVDAIICSLPQSYSNLMSSLLMIYDQMGAPVTPTVIKNTIRKECEARQMAATS